MSLARIARVRGYRIPHAGLWRHRMNAADEAICSRGGWPTAVTVMSEKVYERESKDTGRESEKKTQNFLLF